MKQRRQSDLKIWEGDEDFQPGNVEADLFEQVTEKQSTRQNRMWGGGVTGVW